MAVNPENIVVRVLHSTGHIDGNQSTDPHKPEFRSLQQAVSFAARETVKRAALGAWVGERGVLDVAVDKVECPNCVFDIKLATRK